MKPKTSPYKFTKKQKEPKGKALKSKKIMKIFLMIYYQESNLIIAKKEKIR
jgi:hypothetical protein